MYWDLLGLAGTDNFTPEELTAFGFPRGQALFDAFDRAATRGVRLRFLQDNGTISKPTELLMLQNKHPDNVFYRLWDANAWFGDGIMHMKV